jgi:anaerobic ribonucleoside-triphosphate reductase
MPVDQVIKRDGQVEAFDRRRVENAIYAAARAVDNGSGRQWAETLSWAVVGILEKRLSENGHVPHVEEIQDIVEEVLIKSGHPQVAKAYIIYRQKRAEARAAERMLLDTEKLVDDYLQQLDWRVNENSNMNYSLQGLNFYLASSIAARYWLHKIYPLEVQRAHTEGDMHLHDLGMLSGYTYYGKEVVVLKDDEGIRLTSFEQAYARCPEPEVCLNEADAAFAKYPGGCFVLDKDGWTRVVRLVRKSKDRPMRFLKNRGGRSVIVTDNHPMITRNGETLAAAITPRSDALYTADLGHLLSGETLFSQADIDLLAQLGKAGVAQFGRDRVYFNGVPITDLDVDQAGEGVIHTHTRTIPRRVPLTADFGYFVGFVLAEGYLSYDTDTPRTISITQKGVSVLHKINRALIALGTPGCICHRDKSDLYELQIKNVFLRFLFEHVFGIQPGARHKSLPVHILHYSPDFVRGVLAGIIDGDGSADGNGTCIMIRVSARTLLEQTAYVLQMLGTTPRDRNIEGVGSSRSFKGREIVQRFPLYGLSFRKTAELTLPSSKFQTVAVSSRAWQDETRDEWHVVLNNEPTDIPDDEIYDITTESGTLIVNGMWNHNCCGWDLQDLLIRGFGGVPAKIESRPPRHLRTALGQLVNFFYTLQGEVAGAVAVSNFDTLLAPFIRYDNLDYVGVKQAVQEFVYNINVPTRVGFQSLTWDELVLVRRNGRVEPVEIGRLVDGQFERNRHRVLGQGNGSYAVANADDVQALAFDQEGNVRWVPVKAFVCHRVPQGSTFVRMRTSRGAARVSQAHSMFAFAELNGHCTIRPIAAYQVDIAHGNAGLTPTNHLVAVRRAPNGGTRTRLDLVELIDAVPQMAGRVRVCVPDHLQAMEALQQRARQQFGGLTAFYLEFGIKDKGCWKQWAANRSLPYRVWRALGQDEPGAAFALRNSDLWYPRILDGDRLLEFIRLLGWYITEGHNDITNGLYVSQERGANQEEMERVLRALEALGRTEEMSGWSAKGNPTSTVLRMAGKGLLAGLIGFLGGTYSTNKAIPWFVYDLTHELQETLIATMLRGDGSEFPDHFDYTTTSKKLSLGFSLLLAMNGYKFSVYETSYGRETRSDQYTLRIYRDKASAEGYATGDLLGRVCDRREPFTYDQEYEYDLSVDTPLENFAGGSGLLCFHNTPFTNITMDLTPPPTLRDQAVIISGEAREATYGEFQPEMDLLNRAFAEVMLEGDAHGRVFTFPIPTFNVTSDFDWDNPVLEPVWTMTAKYGIPYIANYINSDMNPEDARSMCCRLRLDQRELRKRVGGLFAAAPLTGSAGVATINLPRLGYLACDEADFLHRLERLMEVARTSLEIKRKMLELLTERGLYPYSRHYLDSVKRQTGAYWSHHFNTIGLIGMNEACLNLLGVGIAHPQGKALAVRTLRFMRDVLSRFQEETGNLYNLEATPAEGASYRLARADKKEFPDILTAGTEATPFYTNCLSGDTEILTKRGWETYEKLVIGDEVLTYDLVTRTLSYQGIRNIYAYDGTWDMLNIRSKAQDQLVTLNHMVLFESGARKGFEFLAPAAHLPQRNFMIRMGASWALQEDDASYSDDLLKLIAWIVTEGHFERDNAGIRITQVRKSRYWEEIRALLDRLHVEYTILGTREGKHKDSIFRISARDGKWIREIVKEKSIPRALLHSLSERQLGLLLLELAKGDGVVNDGQPTRIYTGSSELAGIYQEMAIKTGKRSVVGYGESAYYVDIVNPRCKSWIMHPPTRVQYKGVVWCIEVPNHTFVARRNGKPFITGNSTHLPVGYSDDLFAVLDHQDELQTLYTGGTVLHIFLGEQLHDWRQARKLVRTVAENYHLPYFTLTPTFSICPVHGYIPGEHRYCPYEHTPEELARYGVTC